MSEASNETNLRIGADESVAVTTPTEPTEEVVQADVPGEKPENYVTITLSNPLNENDRMRLGLPADARTEVGQKVRVNKSGASMIIGAGYATVDPEDHVAVREALVADDQAAAAPSAPEAAASEPAASEGGAETAVSEPVATDPAQSDDQAPAPVINDVTPAAAEVPPQEVPIAESTPGSPTPGAAEDGASDEAAGTTDSAKRRR